MKRILLLLATIASLFALSGCGTTQDPAVSNIPWARPASWETSSPGMRF